MALAVCALFDDRSERLVRELWSRLEAVGVGTLATHTHGRHLPHLSYAVLRSWDLARVAEAAAEVPGAGPFAATCRRTLVFPRGRAALAPSLAAAVVARQERLARALAATGADLHRHYLPGAWLPHVSVATRAHGSQLQRVVVEIADTLPLTLRVVRAALIDSATGQQWPLAAVP